MFILLIGPKGSGKSHIGRVLERRLGVHFLQVEPLWLAYRRECAESGREPVIPEGISRVHPFIAQALREHVDVCVETTGASEEILSDLLALAAQVSTLKVRVSAPLEQCLRRIKTRDSTQQIPAHDAQIRLVHALSRRCAFEPDAVLDNDALTDDEIVSAIAPHLEDRGHALPSQGEAT